MQLKRRIKKLERRTGANDKFCRCGTPYFATFVIGGKNIVNNVCPDCGRDIRPRTVAEFVIDAHRYEYEVIEPIVDEIATGTGNDEKCCSVFSISGVANQDAVKTQN